LKLDYQIPYRGFLAIVPFLLLATLTCKAQEDYFLTAKMGRFNQHSYTHLTNIDGIILHEVNSEAFDHIQFGLQLERTLSNKSAILFNIDIPLGGLVDSYAIYDTQDEQFFGSYITKVFTKGVSTSFISLGLSYELISIGSLKIKAQVSPELMLGKNRNAQDFYNLGRQHPRINEIAPLLDNIYRKAVFHTRLAVSASYERFLLELSIKEDFGQSVTDNVNYRGVIYPIKTSRRVTNISLGYTFLKF
jgi:hypothetical protein